ncbi:hypothetical protein P3T76_008754 [Phytophthora citrophthora]|uniref:Uncharacterized protein n=1 Tax=Phytophthora citrophthora TaxID=4793 RepID=A0AAD9GIU5_9STRA|nr:hypothetical protein P3T76_008754 [Phytophthora citrophthora]
MAPSGQRSRDAKRTSDPTACNTGETTRLPYLVSAALKLRDSQYRVDPGTWPAPLNPAEERLEGDQNSSSSALKLLETPQNKELKVKKVKKQVTRLPPELRRIKPQGYEPKLPELDERVLILYHSSLKHARKQYQQQHQILLPHYGHEAIYAATEIQKIFRGVAARKEWRAFYCLRNQKAAACIQFAFQRLLVDRKVQTRLLMKRYNQATRIQAWYRGHRCRDRVLYEHIRTMNQRISNFQRYIRGRRLWRIVMAILHKRRSDVATEIQRCYRGWKGRQRAVAIRFEQSRHIRELVRASEIHSQFPRCKNCQLELCTEDSLFACFMVRYVGLHDFKGAKTLCEDGLRLFPSSVKFVFFYSVLLQAMCEDLDTSMAFLKQAKEIGVDNEILSECETHFFQPAQLLRSNDAQAFLDLAILCQSRDQLSRAEANYVKALAQLPQEYAIPGYLHRVDMVDRLLLNYHRFCSVFNFRQVNVLLKEVSTAKKGKKVRLLVSKLNHYTVVTPADNSTVCRINALYISDDEVLDLLKLFKPDDKEGKEPTAGNTTRGATAWGSSSTSFSKRPVSRTISQKTSRRLSKKADIIQLYQKEFVGLNVKPSDLARFSESRSKLRLTKPAAEFLLTSVAFIDPTTSQPDTQHVQNEDQQTKQVVRKVMLISSILKMRQQHRSAIVCSRAATDIQRAYRGFRLRAEARREKLLSNTRQQQADEMYRRLHENFLLRELRRCSAVAIQKIYKGYAFRKLLRRWRVQAGEIQRVFRGYRGRLRAAAFREGTCTFYMAQRVFQRGVSINGRRVMLIIEKCGLSFRLDGYDLESCVTYNGFFSHSSSMALLCYLNWSYAETLCGREFTRRGDKMSIQSVSAINRMTAECFVSCVGITTTSCIAPLAECVQSINLRGFSTGDKNALMLPLPVRPDDTVRLVEAIAQRVILVPALRMPTQDLKAKSAANFSISVQPPPKMHFIYQQKPHPGSGSPPSALQFVYPITNGLRGVSIGTKHFRKKCARHAVHFTRCRCILPIVSTSAYIEAISRALAPPPTSSLS